MNNPQKHIIDEPVELDLGNGWSVKSDYPPPDIIETMKRELAGEQFSTENEADCAACLALDEWCKEQQRKYGDAKRTGGDDTALSPDAITLTGRLMFGVDSVRENLARQAGKQL
jgi:hypothetical protein